MDWENEMLTTEQLSQRWGVHLVTLRRWRRMNRGPAYVKLGTGKRAKILYKLSAIRDYENSNTIKPEEN